MLCTLNNFQSYLIINLSIFENIINQFSDWNIHKNRNHINPNSKIDKANIVRRFWNRLSTGNLIKLSLKSRSEKSASCTFMSKAARQIG